MSVTSAQQAEIRKRNAEHEEVIAALCSVDVSKFSDVMQNPNIPLGTRKALLSVEIGLRQLQLIEAANKLANNGK